MCIYCEESKTFENDILCCYMGTDCWIDKDKCLVTENAEKDTVDYFRIEYCPMCGEKL